MPNWDSDPVSHLIRCSMESHCWKFMGVFVIYTWEVENSPGFISWESCLRCHLLTDFSRLAIGSKSQFSLWICRDRFVWNGKISQRERPCRFSWCWVPSLHTQVSEIASDSSGWILGFHSTASNNFGHDLILYFQIMTYNSIVSIRPDSWLEKDC